MSGEQGGKRGGRGRGKGRRNKGRGSQQRQSESNVPGGLQTPRDEERGATALPVSHTSQQQPERKDETPAGTSGHEQRQQRGGKGPRKQRQGQGRGDGRQKTAQTTQGQFSESLPEATAPPSVTPSQPPITQHPGGKERPSLGAPARTQQPSQKQQQQKQHQRQPDQTDGGTASKPAQQQPSVAHGGARPKTSQHLREGATSAPLKPHEQQQAATTLQETKSVGKQPQASKPGIPFQQQPSGPPRSDKAEPRPPLRPDKGGTVGRPINLRVNFLPVQLSTDDIHHYDTEIKAKGIKKGDGYTKSEAPRIIQEMVKLYERDNPRGPKVVYDKNGKNLYCKQPIPGIGKDKREFEVKFSTDNGKERDYTVKVQWVSQVSLYNLNEALEGRLTEIPRDTLQAVEVVLRYLPSMTNIPVGSSLFSYPDGNEKDLGDGLQIWNGTFVSIRPTQWKMMLNVDTSSTTFYKAQPVLDFMCEHLYLRQIPARLDPRQRKDFRKEMKTIKIETTYVKRKQRVSGLSDKSAKEEKFKQDDGQMITVFDYFKTKHGITLRYPDLPCLKIGAKGSCIPIELCNIVQGQQKQGRLTPNQQREMIRHTALPAPQRLQKIAQLVRDAKFDQDPYCRDFGIRVGSEMVRIKGRVLDPPLLNYGPSDQPRKEKPRDGAWNLQEKQMYDPKELNEWALVSYENPRFFDERAMDFFIGKLVAAGKEKRLRIHPSPCYRATKRGHESIGHLFGQLHRDFPNLELIIVIFPGKGSTDEYYEEVKHYGDVIYGIRTQCLKANTATRKAGDPQTMSNVCLKINAKLGGTTSVLDKVIRSPILKRPVIIFGADVTHPSPGDNSPSIAAVVASMDAHPNLYSAEVRVQAHRKEMITELKDMFKVLLQKFRRSTGAKPEKLIFYRDGVSEGQFKEVLIYELQAIQRACLELHESFKPLITFIVVQKRHHARFFAEDPRDQKGKSKNIPAGTVVDTQVCHPFEFDWYLCSHAGIQGTSKPAHYHVLYDDSNFSSDDLQILSNQLCHTYVRCARAVSIPAPAYYAHHVAFRARYHLKEVERGSSEGSVASGGDGPVLPPDEMIRAVRIHDRMNSTMYFA